MCDCASVASAGSRLGGSLASVNRNSLGSPCGCCELLSPDYAEVFPLVDPEFEFVFVFSFFPPEQEASSEPMTISVSKIVRKLLNFITTPPTCCSMNAF
jgi:hypothetical protein